MAKQVKAQVKLQLPGGQATPAPPVGPMLGPYGITGQFVKQFNDATRDKMGTIIPVVITIYQDKSFDFIMKAPPASVLIKKEANIAKGAARPGHEAVGKITRSQLRKIAEIKMPDLNTKDVEKAMRILAGTARSMGVIIEED